MKFLIILSTILILANAHQSQRFIHGSADPDKPGYCLHKELKLSFKEGDTVEPSNIGECVAFECMAEGLIAIRDCPAYATHCHVIPADYSKTFPDCCARAKCEH